MTRVPFRTRAEIEAALPLVLAQLRADGLIAYPTETVYGFGGAVTVAAAARLTELKRREPHKPFLLLITDPAQAPGVQWADSARTLARLFWPGPLTLALPARAGDLPAGVVSVDGMVALRATPHDAIRTLIDALGSPITSSSANAPRQPPARSAAAAEAVLAVLGADDVLVLDGGPLPPSLPSTIVACDENGATIVREGVITRAVLRTRLQGTGLNVD